MIVADTYMQFFCGKIAILPFKHCSDELWREFHIRFLKYKYQQKND